MSGGKGSDVYVVNSSDDRVIEKRGGGSGDEIQSSRSFKIAANVETLRLTGRGDNDATGNNGANELIGNAGDNVLNGGKGADVLTGRAGADTFEFRSIEAAGRGSSRDTITDFDRSDDLVDLRRVDADTGRSGNQAFDFIGSGRFSDEAGELRFSGGVLAGDVDGDGAADFQIALDGVARLFANDILL